MDDKKRAARYWFAFLILAVLLVVLFIWNVNAGSIHLSVGEILNIIFIRVMILPTISYGRSVFRESWQSLFWEEHFPFPDFSFRRSLTIRSRVLLYWEFLPVQNWWWLF